MIAATSPAFTVRFRPSRIGLPCISTLRSLTSSIITLSFSLFAVEIAERIVAAADIGEFGGDQALVGRHHRGDGEFVGIGIFDNFRIETRGKAEIAQLRRTRIDDLM